jgi:hypothetical protein
LDPIQTINCFIQIANESGLLVKNIIDIQTETNIFLKLSDGKVELYKRNRETSIKVRDFERRDLKPIQQFLFRMVFK